ncbi:MAG: hypothetical protein KF823_03325 [Xanthomonadales bacterium]|nr:hypothetical protein [Xanthomonadales bacterium]
MIRPATPYRFALAGALALMLAACGKDEPAAAAPSGSGPEATIVHSARLLREGDLGKVVEASVPPAQLEQARQSWLEQIRKDDPSDEDRAQFAETMSRLTAPDAEAQLMAEIRPQLEQFQGDMRAQLPAMVAMGKGFLIAAINESEEIKPEQRPQVVALVNAVGSWVETGEFASVDRAEKAVREVTAAARRMNVTTLDHVQAKDFDGVMQLASIGFDGFKKALNAYDIDLDASFESVRAEVLERNGNEAKVRVHFQFLGTPLTFDTTMVEIDGRWYGKDAIENLDSISDGA